MSNHANFTAAHRPFAAVYADASARLAATGFPRGEGGTIIPFASADLYKEALQLSDASRWILTDDSPVTWVQSTGTGSVGVDNSTIEISSGNLRVKDDGVTYAKMQNISAASKLLGRGDSGAGDPQELSVGAGLSLSGTTLSATGGSGGVGDVVGPATAVDNALARFDLTTGKLIQNSAVSIDDNGAITVPEIAAPATPAAGKVVIYAKSDNKVYRKGEDGVEAELGGGGGSLAPLVVEDANTVSQRNGATNQHFRVMKSYTDATHWAGVRIRSDSSNLIIEGTHEGGSHFPMIVQSGSHLYLASASFGFNWHIRGDNGALESGGSNGILCGGTLRVGSEAGFLSSNGAQGNLMRVTDNNLTTTPGALSFKQPVIAKTSSPESVTVDETGFVFTNAGASGAMNFNLPAATKGLTFTFYVDASQTVTVTATNSHTIREGSTVGAANGNIASGATKGSMIKLTCFTDGEWVVEYRQLTWTIS